MVESVLSTIPLITNSRFYFILISIKIKETLTFFETLDSIVKNVLKEDSFTTLCFLFLLRKLSVSM